MKTKLQKLLAIILVICLGFTALPINAEAATAKINKKTATIYVGKTVQLKVTGASQKVAWSTSNKKVAKVTSKGKVTGVSKGTATVSAKVGTKKYSCKVTVKTEKNVTFTLNKDLVPKDTTAKDVQNVVKKNGYISGKLNSDGSVTYTMSNSVYQKELKEYKKEIDTAIDEMLSGDEKVEEFEEITYNDKMSEFNIVVNDNYNTFTPIFSLAFFVYGGYYQVLSKVPESERKVIVNYIDSNGKILSTSDSTAK